MGTIIRTVLNERCFFLLPSYARLTRTSKLYFMSVKCPLMNKGNFCNHVGFCRGPFQHVIEMLFFSILHFLIFVKQTNPIRYWEKSRSESRWRLLPPIFFNNFSIFSNLISFVQLNAQFDTTKTWLNARHPDGSIWFVIFQQPFRRVGWPQDNGDGVIVYVKTWKEQSRNDLASNEANGKSWMERFISLQKNQVLFWT